MLRALDYFRAAAHLGAPNARSGTRPDSRLDEAARYVESRRLADGRWILDRAYDEGFAIQTGESVGEPSRWNTLRAMRVLRWLKAARTN